MQPDSVKDWSFRPMFVTLNGRQLFALHVLPQQRACRGCVLYLPAFAEEMNRFRLHASLAARALASAGYQCLLLDPYGTGESEGEITDGDWDIWIEDAVAAARWLHTRAGQPLTLWGARTGALMAAEAAVRLAGDVRTPVQSLLLWQPVIDGKLFLNQYLRLRIASQLVHDVDRETTTTILARLHAGEVLEVAGYPLTGRLADSLAACRLDTLLQSARTSIAWAEVMERPDQPLAMPSLRLIDQLKAGGTVVDSEAVCGPLVWQVHARVDAPELTAGTLRLMGVQP
jgi:exosortase A-associated hydrolase 2